MFRISEWWHAPEQIWASHPGKHFLHFLVSFGLKGHWSPCQKFLIVSLIHSPYIRFPSILDPGGKSLQYLGPSPNVTIWLSPWTSFRMKRNTQNYRCLIYNLWSSQRGPVLDIHISFPEQFVILARIINYDFFPPIGLPNFCSQLRSAAGSVTKKSGFKPK